jgi:hypothetical protein
LLKIIIIINDCPWRRFSTSCIVSWQTFDKYNFSTLFFKHQRPFFNSSYQKIVQAKLTNVNNNFMYYGPHDKHIFQKNKNIESFHMIFYMDLYLNKKIPNYVKKKISNCAFNVKTTFKQWLQAFKSVNYVFFNH